jgi:dolichyl-phosphate-mannose--protein O-mannosyl transferase
MRKLQGSGSWHHLDSKILEFIVAQKQFFIVIALLCLVVGILFILSVIVYGLFHICRKTYKSLTWSPMLDIPISYGDHLDLLAFRK